MQRAMLYVRGNDTERQREICEAYAKKNGFYIKGTTESLPQAFERSVEYDVLITAGVTRISRDKRNYDKIIDMFDDEGITVKIAD